jgi:hypothetical protein
VSLPYPVFEGLVDEDDVGRSTGAFFASVGVARLFAPLLVGAAIDLGAIWMPDVQGYPMMWPVAGALILLGGRYTARHRTAPSTAGRRHDAEQAA